LRSELDGLSPPWLGASGRQLLVTNEESVIIAGLQHVAVNNPEGTAILASPLNNGMIGQRLLDILGPSQPLTTFGALAGSMEVQLADGTAAFATVRHLYSGQLAIIQRRDDALAVWNSDATLTVTLSATTGFVVLILGFAFHWQ